MNDLTFAFFMGLLGSVHCVMMCGPLVMALPVSGYAIFQLFIHRLLYQTGRITTYSIIGLIAGGIGHTFNLLGWQQAISTITGLLLITIALAQFLKKRLHFLDHWQKKIITPLSALMGKWLTKPYGGFLTGMLNGILPCGMVYTALLGALNMHTVMDGAEFMLLFGLGTIPLMLMTALSGIYFRKWLSHINFTKTLSYLTLVIGLWFILRGGQWHIPYISPLIHVDSPELCH